MGFAIARLLPERVDTEYLDESERDDERARRYEEGLAKINQLEVDRAKSIFRSLHRDYPDDREVLLQWYKTEKLGSIADDLHVAAGKILSMPGEDAVTLTRVHETFCDYLKVTRGRARISPAALVKLSIRFSKGDHPETAERILSTLLRTGKEVASLDNALLALATAWERAGNAEKGRQYRDELERRFPEGAGGAAHALVGN